MHGCENDPSPEDILSLYHSPIPHRELLNRAFGFH